MNPIDANKIDATNRILQQIKAENGPTPLVFTLVKLKTLCFELLQTSLDNAYLRQLYGTLQYISQRQVNDMLDCYQQNQQQAYQEIFTQIQHRIDDLVKELPY